MLRRDLQKKTALAKSDLNFYGRSIAEYLFPTDRRLYLRVFQFNMVITHKNL
jgi:hypothetical protein